MAAAKLAAGTSTDSPGPIYRTQLVKYWPLQTQRDVTIQSIRHTTRLLPCFLLLAGIARVCVICQCSELWWTNNLLPLPTSSYAFCHSYLLFASGRWSAALLPSPLLQFHHISAETASLTTCKGVEVSLTVSGCVRKVFCFYFYVKDLMDCFNCKTGCY